MPTYEYVCDGCGHAYERFQSITASPDRTCPKCGKRKVRRKIGIGAGVLFKGTGFYETDYRSDGYSKAAEAERKNSETPKADSPKKEGGEAAKPAETGAKAEKPEKTSGSGGSAGATPKEPRVKTVHPSREGRGQGNLRRAKSAPRPRARRKGRALRKIVSIVAILAVVLVVAAVLLIDVIARVGIEVAGSKVLGVPTTVRNVDLGLIKDRSSVSGLDVANPTGYTDPTFLSLGQASLTARLGELTGDQVTIRNITLQDLTLTLEKDAAGKLNATRISDNLPSTGEQQQAATQPDAGKSRKVVVQELRIERVKVRLRNLVGGRQGVVEANLPDIVLKDVASDGSVDVLASQVSGMVIGSVLQATVTANIEGLSGEVMQGLKGALKDSVNALPANLQGPVESIRGTMGEALDKAGEQIQKGVGDALQGLFGGKDKPKSPGN
jgi:putative FmdB family regulatory protein